MRATDTTTRAAAFNAINRRTSWRAFISDLAIRRDPSAQLVRSIWGRAPHKALDAIAAQLQAGQIDEASAEFRRDAVAELKARWMQDREGARMPTPHADWNALGDGSHQRREHRNSERSTF